MLEKIDKMNLFRKNPYLSEKDIFNISTLFNNGLDFCISNVLNNFKGKAWRNNGCIFAMHKKDFIFSFRGSAHLGDDFDKRALPANKYMEIIYELKIEISSDKSQIKFNGTLIDNQWSFPDEIEGTLFKNSDDDYCDFFGEGEPLVVKRICRLSNVDTQKLDADFHDKITKQIFDGAIQFFIDLANGRVKAFEELM